MDMMTMIKSLNSAADLNKKNECKILITQRTNAYVYITTNLYTDVRVFVYKLYVFISSVIYISPVALHSYIFRHNLVTITSSRYKMNELPFFSHFSLHLQQ